MRRKMAADYSQIKSLRGKENTYVKSRPDSTLVIERSASLGHLWLNSSCKLQQQEIFLQKHNQANSLCGDLSIAETRNVDLNLFKGSGFVPGGFPGCFETWQVRSETCRIMSIRSSTTSPLPPDKTGRVKVRRSFRSD